MIQYTLNITPYSVAPQCRNRKNFFLLILGEMDSIMLANKYVVLFCEKAKELYR